MGFMDFLKKESKDLKFKENNQSKDSFDTIPPPPKEASAAGQNNQQSSTSGQEKQAPAFPGAEQNTPNQGMPSFPESKPDVQSQSAESLFPESQSNQTQDHSEFMPPSDFDEQPEFPEKESLDNIGWDQDPAYTSAEPKEVLDNQTGNNPFEKDNNQDDEDLSLPDLPDIPSSAMSDSLGASANKQEETAEKSDEQKSFDDVNNAQDNMNEQGSTQREPEPQTQKPAEKKEEEPDTLPELDAEYLPEDEAIEEEEKEQFVESHQFYETLQDIKAIKRGFKDADKVMKDWSELDGSVEEEAEKFMETIDTLQEEMIKIDSALFEEE